ncbi:MAG: hypothetical protein MUD12_08265 [Spirochaetes bacterium]|jgi:hypothetical protein|nr:hypothetical protein [Spirochaetota bacterium]
MASGDNTNQVRSSGGAGGRLGRLAGAGMEFISDRKKLGHFLKAVIVLILIGIAAYFFYYKSVYGKASFIISDSEITSADEGLSKTEFKAGEKLYFMISRYKKQLDAGVFIIKIEVFKDTDYAHYKQISYEINRDFQKISCYIPDEYFKLPGKYRVRAYLDNESVAIKDFEVK